MPRGHLNVHQIGYLNTIRYLGGFLSTYDLTNALYNCDEPRLIEKAKEVADMMSVAWSQTVVRARHLTPVP